MLISDTVKGSSVIVEIVDGSGNVLLSFTVAH
jgi:hypothetical protein